MYIPVESRPSRPDPTPVTPLAGACCSVRGATPADLSSTAVMHIRELPVGLFPRLGPRFVARWHRACLESRHAVALVAVHRGIAGDERVTGFLMGALDRRAFHNELLTRHRTALLLRGVAALAARPHTLAYFLRTRLRPYLRGLLVASTRPGGVPRRHPDVIADLTAIAVSPPWRGTGTGRLLVDAFSRRCAEAGVPTVELVTAAGYAATTAFYERAGWTARQREITRDGLPVQRYDRSTGVV